MITGFTGSSRRISGPQKSAVLALIIEAEEIHHGDCIVADEWAHKCATGLGKRVVIHPPDEQKARAFCYRSYTTEGVTELPTRPYLERNHDIVDASDYLIAVPNRVEADGQAGGGVWATVRYARRKGIPITIVRPSGTIEADVPPPLHAVEPVPEVEPTSDLPEATPKTARAKRAAKEAAKADPKAGVAPRPKAPSKRAAKRAAVEPERPPSQPEPDVPEPDPDPDAEGRGKSW